MPLYRSLNFYLLSICIIGLAGCATTSTPTVSDSSEDEPIVSKVKEYIDYDKLQSNLNMKYPRKKLGFFEKRFNTCKAGAGFVENTNCRKRRLAVVNFQLVCRDSTGTVEEAITDYELVPVVSTRINWKLGYFSGRTHTDLDGYGKIRQVTPGSSKGQGLQLRIGKNALRLEVDGVRRIVVPKDWCER